MRGREIYSGRIFLYSVARWGRHSTERRKGDLKDKRGVKSEEIENFSVVMGKKRERLGGGTKRET